MPTERLPTDGLTVLVVGGGGREHTIAWSLTSSPRVDRVFCAPGNGGTAALIGCDNLDIADDDLDALLAAARRHNVDLAVIGPEIPLSLGIVDHFADAGITAFGPTGDVARLESSKAHAKSFMARHSVPTANVATFADAASAHAHLATLSEPPVVKASGLAAGKGVLIPETMADAADAIDAVMVERRFGAAGDEVLLEERLVGPEISVLAFVDGTSWAVMPMAQDHKRIFDGDQGPNTGGMGAFVPSPHAAAGLLAEIDERVIGPTVTGLAAEGTPFVGVLFVGIMLTADGPKVLEYNCRFGDPETQAVLPLLDSDLVDAIEACLDGALDRTTISWSSSAAASVVLASAGYPETSTKGVSIDGVAGAEQAGCVVFHAGTATDGNDLVTAGGRVLAVTAVAPDLDGAVAQAYDGVDCIEFDGSQHRNDIGRHRP